MERQKNFIVNGKKYTFYGDSVSVIAEGDIKDKTLFPYKEINSHRAVHLKTLCLVVNNQCNLCCEYCFANKGMYDKPDQIMSFCTARKAIDLLIESAMKSSKNDITISFFGGEPLLNIELIKKCVKYIKKFKDINCNYMITTNGTLLNQSIVDFLQKNNFDIMISIDGNKATHDFYRKFYSGKGSYEKVIKGISLFENKNSLNARITINNNNPQIHSYIDDILKLGIKRITFAVDYNISNDAFLIFIDSLKKLINKYYIDIVSGNFYEITNFSSIITSIVLHQRKLAFCNAGISYLTVSADGKFYRCPRFVGKEEFSLGTVERIENVKKQMHIFKESLKSAPGERNRECKECVYSFICGGMCYHHAIMAGKNEFENVPMECFQRKILFDAIIKMICKLSTEDRRKLLLFYTRLWNNVKGGPIL